MLSRPGLVLSIEPLLVNLLLYVTGLLDLSQLLQRRVLGTLIQLATWKRARM